ncbi:MAG: hypothetical protein EAY65_04435 [Alphaproteobacteria bacterium]|nr:MAG: hypothetical protein EAY65_04435 [Alphaproteobacteria bacterium]
MNDESKTPDLVPAHTKPHYWIMIRGAEVWNRWARGGATDDWFSHIDKKIINLKGLDAKKLEAFKALIPLGKAEGDAKILEEILADIRTFCVTPHSGSRIAAQDFEQQHLPVSAGNIDFRSTLWNSPYRILREYDTDEKAILLRTRLSEILKTKLFDSDVDLVIDCIDIDFEEFVFPDSVYFDGARFVGNANFLRTQFVSNVSFSETSFQDEAWFGGVQFYSQVLFKRTRFCNEAYFNQAKFHWVVKFKKAHFYSFGTFVYSTFAYDADFSHATFYHVPNISGAECEGLWIFPKEEECWSKIKPDAGFEGSELSNAWQRIELAYSQIRKRMEELKLHHWELFFHAKEMEAQRQQLLAQKAQIKVEIVTQFKTLIQGKKRSKMSFLRRQESKLPTNARLPASVNKADPPPQIKQKIKTLLKVYVRECLYTAYKNTSDYGQSIARPIFWIFYWIIACAFVYWIIIGITTSFVLTSGGVIKTAFLHAFYNVLPNISTETSMSEATLTICKKDMNCLGAFYIVATFHKLVSFFLWFLLGLGIRNRFKLR